MKIKKILAFGIAPFLCVNAHSQNYTITFDGITYNNVGVQPVSGLTYDQFYSIASAQPWFLGEENCYVLNTCDADAIRFTLTPDTGAAVIRAMLPVNYIPDVSNVEAYLPWGIGLSNFLYTDPDYFGGLLYLMISPVDTQLSFFGNSIALRNAFNLQSSKMAQGLSYDCTVFDANNICVSFAGTRSNVDNGFDATTGALIIAHRPTANIRFGAYVDQNIGTSDSNGLKVKRGSPGYGVFSVWSQRTDGLGTQVRASANSGKVDIETTRLAVGTAEEGFGASNIKSNGIQLEVSQGYAVNNQWVVRPYLGYRQMTNKRGAYTETASVDYPLTYAALKQTTESILAGVRFIGKLTPQTSLTLSAGMERDIKSSVDDYKATETDIGDMSLSMAENKKQSRPTASLGMVHYIDKTQTIGLSVVHRKEALQSGNTTTGMLQYSVGY